MALQAADHNVRVYRLLGIGFVLMTLSTVVTYKIVQQSSDPPEYGAGGSIQMHPLGQRILRCTKTLTDEMLPGSVIKQPEDERSLGAEDGGSASGKLLYCLGREAGVHRAAMYFLGFTDPDDWYGCSGKDNTGKQVDYGAKDACKGRKKNQKKKRRTGAHSLAYGMAAGHAGVFAQASACLLKQQWRMFVPEAEPTRCKLGAESFLHDPLLPRPDLVAVKCGWVPDDAAWVRKNVCPSGALDLFATDFDMDVAPHLFKNVITICRPLMIFVENSGMYDWKNDNDEWMLYNTKMLRDARGGIGNWDLWVDQEDSDLANFPGQGRKHALYVRRGVENVCSLTVAAKA